MKAASDKRFASSRAVRDGSIGDRLLTNTIFGHTCLSTTSGFTIMEVMVAIMILAVSVVSIFGAQFTAVAATEFSKNITQAINLAECKMNEIELEILTEDGFKLGNVDESGECCEAMDDEHLDGEFECSWEIKVVELPDLSEALLGGADGGGGLLGDLSLGTSSLEENDPAEEGDFMGVVESFAPMLSDILSEGIRRVSVTVRWKQGAREPEYTLSQFVVHPTEGTMGLLTQAMADDGLSDSEGVGNAADTSMKRTISGTAGGGMFGGGLQ